MSANYTKAVWTGNELITAADLNRIENGIAGAVEEINNVASSTMPDGIVPIEKGGSAHSTAKGARVGFSAATAIAITDTPTWANIFAKLDEIPSGTTATIVTNSDNAAKLTNNNTYNQSGLRGFVTRSLDTNFYFTCEYGTSSPRILTWVISDFTSASSTPTVSTVTVFNNSDTIIPVEKGGTGHSTVKDARTELGAATSITIAPSNATNWENVYAELNKIPTGETATILTNGYSTKILTNNAYDYPLRGIVARSGAGGVTSFYFMCEVGASQPRILIWSIIENSTTHAFDFGPITVCGDTTNFVDTTTAANFVDKTKPEYYPSKTIDFEGKGSTTTGLWDEISSLPTGRTICALITHAEVITNKIGGSYFGEIVRPNENALLLSLNSYGSNGGATNQVLVIRIDFSNDHKYTATVWSSTMTKVEL